MTTRHSSYEHILSLLPSLSQAEQLALFEELQRQIHLAPPEPEPPEAFLQQIDRAFGIWADRTDLPENSGDYVRQLRAGWNERLQRLDVEVRDADA